MFSGLYPGTTYLVSVRARTAKGFGQTALTEITTNISGEGVCMTPPPPEALGLGRAERQSEKLLVDCSLLLFITVMSWTTLYLLISPLFNMVVQYITVMSACFYIDRLNPILDQCLNWGHYSWALDDIFLLFHLGLCSLFRISVDFELYFGGLCSGQIEWEGYLTLTFHVYKSLPLPGV